ncbi:MAG: ATP-binding protein [Proteobacteria bacterium]|nr:ATP-binding protein [Pseudomonadota bacterium]
MIKRQIEKELINAGKEYPVVTILGPRQSGKTTLARMTYPDVPYFSLESPDVRLAAQRDPRSFLNRMPEGGILDEIQKLPEILSFLQEIIDKPGSQVKFILTGSHQPELSQSISQSLAGRTAVLNLLPFSFKEIRNYSELWDSFELVFRGFYPRLYEENLQPSRFYTGYTQTYLERDVRSLINLRDLRPFQQFLVLLAGRVGQIINYTSLSNDVGVSATTIKFWIEALKASFVVFELPPYFENIRKRVVKSPKIYFTDVGLASYLLGIESEEQAQRDPLRGNLYENLIISEILKYQFNRGKRPDLFFYRDTHGNEVDLILKQGRTLIPFEIKSAATFTDGFTKGIDKFRNLVGDRSQNGFVLYNGNERFAVNKLEIINPLKHGEILF